MKLTIDESSCTGCGSCVIACPANYPLDYYSKKELVIENGKVTLVGELCNGCGVCVNSCPFNAMCFKPSEQKESLKSEKIFESIESVPISRETKLDINPNLLEIFKNLKKSFSTALLRSMFEYKEGEVSQIATFVHDFEKKFKHRTTMPERDPEERIKDFDEITNGYSTEDAIKEAERCFQCTEPRCKEGCPVGVNIPEFIRHIRERNLQKVIDVIKDKNPFPAITGRVCPQELQCESNCALNFCECDSVAIGRLERFVGDWELQSKKEIKLEKAVPTGKRIAVVGSGPAGLTCAAELAKKGHEVTIYEPLHKPGGVLVYGIPEFRLPKEIVEKEIDYVKMLGVKIITDVLVGNTLTVDDLLQEHEAVFLGTGAGLPKLLGIEGEGLPRIYSANEYLIRVNLMKAYKSEYDTPIKVGKKVAVVGGGNVAMDAARCALRLGAEDVYIIYRRSEKEMPARLEEIERAKEEGIHILDLNKPVRFIGDDKVEKIELLEMQLGEPDSSGRRRPEPIEGSNYTMDIDVVVIAVGQRPHPVVMQTTPGLEVNERKGTIIVNQEGKTSRERVYAGGDVTTGAATVVSAMGAGREAAEAIDITLNESQLKQR